MNVYFDFEPGRLQGGHSSTTEMADYLIEAIMRNRVDECELLDHTVLRARWPKWTTTAQLADDLRVIQTVCSWVNIYTCTTKAWDGR